MTKRPLSWGAEAEELTRELEASSRPAWMPSQEQIDGYLEDLRGARVLVTGSKGWDDRRSISASLKRALKFLGKEDPEQATLIHGAERGAEKLASTIALREGFIIESHPAERWRHSPECPAEDPGDGGCWQGRNSCRRATQRRNREVLSSDGDILLAFIEDGDPGPSAMLREWTSEGLPAILCSYSSETESLAGEFINMDSWK